MALVSCWVWLEENRLCPHPRPSPPHHLFRDVSTTTPEPASTHLSPPCKCGCYSQPRLLDAGHEQRGGICPQPTHLLSSPASRVQWANSLCGGAAEPGPSPQQSIGQGERRVEVLPAPTCLTGAKQRSHWGRTTETPSLRHAGPSCHLLQAAFPDPTLGTGTHLSLQMPSALCICLFVSEKLDLNVQSGCSFILPIGILHFHVYTIGTIK